jgi:hypothetical protein
MSGPQIPYSTKPKKPGPILPTPPRHASPPRKRVVKNSGFKKSYAAEVPALTLPMYEVEKREQVLNDLLLYMTGYMNTDIDPVVVENVLKKALLPLLHDEIRMALEGSSEARRYLLDKMIPKAEKVMTMPALNISIFLDKEKKPEPMQAHVVKSTPVNAEYRVIEIQSDVAKAEEINKGMEVLDLGE